MKILHIGKLAKSHTTVNQYFKYFGIIMANILAKRMNMRQSLLRQTILTAALALCAAAASPEAGAQETWTLHDCMLYAIEHSPQMRI